MEAEKQQEKVIILYSSDSTSQYRKDIINVIGLPENGIYRFRYKEQYVIDELKEIIRNDPDSLTGDKAIIVFRTNSVSKKKDIDAFFVPIRYATIESAKEIGSFFTFIFTVNEFPSFSEVFEKACRDYEGIKKLSTTFFTDEKRDVFADLFYKNQDNSIQGFPYIETESQRGEKQQERAWLSIIEAITKYNKFQNTFFYKTTIKLPASGRVEMQENKQSIIEVIHYHPDYDGDHSAVVRLDYDTEVVVSSCGGTERIECGYDNNEYSFIPKDVPHDIDSQITLNFYDEIEEQGTTIQKHKARIRIPIRIKRNKWKGAKNIILTAIGGGLIGFNEVVSVSSPYNWLLYVAGVAALGCSWIWPKGGD